MLLTVLALSTIAIGCKKDKSPEPAPCTQHLSAEDITVEIDEHPHPSTVIAKIDYTACNGTVEFSTNNFITNINELGEIRTDYHHNFNFETNNGKQEVVYQLKYTGQDTVFVRAVTVTFKMRDIDELHYFLSDSKSRYESASKGEWIKVTADEFADVKSNMNGQTCGIRSDDLTTTGQSFLSLKANKLARNGNGISSGRFLFGFGYRNLSLEKHTKVEVRASEDANPDKNYIQVGNTLPTHNVGYNYFVLKGGHMFTATHGSVALYGGEHAGVAYYPRSNRTMRVGPTKTKTDQTYADHVVDMQGIYLHEDWYID